MIKLPHIPYSMPKNRSTEITIRGLNLGAMASPGDIVESKNVSLRKYPFVTAEKKDTVEIDSGNVTSITSFAGELVTIRGGKLYAGLSILDGYDKRKQSFAAINTKLTMFPARRAISKLDGGGWEETYLYERSNNSRAIFSPDAIIGGIRGGTDSSGYRGYVSANTLVAIADKEITGTTSDPRVYCAGNTENPNNKFLAGFNKNFTIELQSGRSTGYLVYESTKLPDFMNIGDVFYFAPAGIEYSEYSDFYIVKNRYWSGMSFFSVARLGEPDAAVAFPDDIIGTAYYEVTSDLRGYIDSLIRVGSSTVGMTYFFGAAPENNNIRIVKDEDNIIAPGVYDKVTLPGWNVNFKDLVMPGSKATVVVPTRGFMATGTVATVQKDAIIFDENLVNGIQKVSPLAPGGKIHVITGCETVDYTNFNMGDVVDVSLCQIDGADVNNTAFKIVSIENGAIIAESEIFTPGISDNNVTIAREIPDLDFVCEKDNRLYGCSNKDNTIYVSALGDPTNMYAYEGISTDAYAVAVGSDGDFTGCCKYGSSVLFFKENMIYKLTGSYPAEYALYSYSVDGVQEGCNESLVTINEILYYKGKRGVFAYGGDLPTLISESFGDKKFKDAAAGTDGESYYISMVDEQDKPYLFSYNTRLGIWLIEGNIKCDSFTRLDNDVYYISEGNVYKLHANDDSNVEWLVQYAPIYETIEGKKTQSRLLIRAEIPKGSYLIVKMRCDDGAWVEVGKVAGKCSGVVPLRIPINRCDKFELKFEGKGKITFQSMLREFYIGSDK